MKLSTTAGGSMVAQARAILAKSISIRDAKQLRDQSNAIAFYARERGESAELVQEATEARLVFERHIGELTAALPKATKQEAGRSKGGRKKAGNTAIPATKRAALDAAGISKVQASRWEKLARMPPQAFDRLAKARGAKATKAGGGKASSPSIQERRTPQWLYDALNAKFGPFSIDLFAEPHNALHKRFLTAEDDALKDGRVWPDNGFANHTFKLTTRVIRRAAELAVEHKVRTTIIAPVGCSQVWYHECAIQGTIWVPDMRINYDLPEGVTDPNADRDSIIITFGPRRSPPAALVKQGKFYCRRLMLRKLAPVVVD